jgi:hypothetical protein
MPLLPLIGSKVNMAAGTVSPSDTYKDGLRYVGAAVRGEPSLTPVGYSQGLPVDADGKICLVDATVALPAGTTFQNGFPLSNQALCISTNSQVSWSNGIPMDVNGAVCV